MFKLAVLSLKNRALIALITVVAAVFGSMALVNLKQELIPSIEFPALMVITTYPGASPEVVNTDVSTPIESAIQAVPGLESTTATSATNASVIQASFAYGTDLSTAEQKMTQAINRVSSQLPESADPQVLLLSIDDLPAVQLAVSGGDSQTIQTRLENIVVPELEKIAGVNQASILGATSQSIVITPDQAKLATAGFSQQAISDALDQNGVLFPGGTVDEGDTTLTVQTGTKVTSVDDVKSLPLVPSDATQMAAGALTIADVASVELSNADATSLSRVNGEDALTIAVTKLGTANTVEVSKAISDLLPELESQLDGGKITVIFDQAPYIQQSIEALAQEGLLGLVFAVIVILVFLLSFRATIVTAISIPTSVLITLIGLQAMEYSLNILTLGALTMAIGRVVDDSIVVIENIKRHYVGGADKMASIVLAVKEVAGAITASTITTVAVFLPIALVGDMTGELFRPFALTVTIAMLSSLLVALTIVPVLAYWFMKPGKELRDVDGNVIDPESPEAPPSRLQKSYLPILRWTLKHAWVTMLISVLVLGGTFASAQFMKTNFLGDSGQNTMTVQQEMPPATSLAVKDEAAKKVETALEGIDGIKTVLVSVGSSGSPLTDAFSGGSSGATFSLTLTDDADQEQVRADIQAKTGELSGAGKVTIASAASLGSSDIEVEVTAPDSASLEKATQAVQDKMSGLDSVEQVTSNLAASQPYVAVEVDRAKAAAVGVSEVAVGGMVSAAMQPQNAGTIEIDDASVTVVIATDNPPTSIDELSNLQVPTALGLTPLSEIATVKETDGPTSISTQNGQRTATVAVTPKGDDLSTASVAVTTALDSVDLPQGADAKLGGVITQQNDSFVQLGIAMLAAILIIYVVMVATFKSLRQPLLLLISVPFAATGAILLQIVTQVPLGVASLIGVLMLIGIVVTNAIVLVDLVNQYRNRGLSTYGATVAGSSMRLRPILMTALATIFALTPMALGITGHGGFISQPLAIVVIGGLVSSTVLTLVVLPTLYNLVEGAKERRRAKRAGLPVGKGGSEVGSAGVAGVAGGSGAAGGSDADALGDSGADAGVDAAVPATRRAARDARLNAAGGAEHVSGETADHASTGVLVADADETSRGATDALAADSDARADEGVRGATDSVPVVPASAALIENDAHFEELADRAADTAAAEAEFGAADAELEAEEADAAGEVEAANAAEFETDAEFETEAEFEPEAAGEAELESAEPPVEATDGEFTLDGEAGASHEGDSGEPDAAERDSDR